MKLITIFLSIAASSLAIKRSQPHLIILLVDDLGHHNTELTNEEAFTPAITELVSTSGRRLNRHYSYKYCSPSRSSLLSGRYPIHVNEINPSNVNSTGGVDLRMTMLPKKLKEANYTTAMVGKWHLGARQTSNLPTRRGFDYFFGFLGGGEDHDTQISYEAFNSVDLWGGEKGEGPSDRNGTNSCLLYGNDANEFIKNHDADATPLFMFISLQNCHSPYTSTEAFMDLNSNITDYPQDKPSMDRRAMQAMMTCADEVTKNVTNTLHEKGMFDDTLMLWSSDNGGPSYWAANNHPFRGTKGSGFEGGVRVISFIAGGKNVLDESLVGQDVDEKIMFADWYSTFCSLAGVDDNDEGSGEVPNVDGIDLSELLLGKAGDGESKRRTILPIASDTLIVEDEETGVEWKIVRGNPQYQNEGLGFWQPECWPSAEHYFPNQEEPDVVCKSELGCLFNLSEDELELNDLSDVEVEKLQEMSDLLDQWVAGAWQTGDDGYQDPHYLNCTSLEKKIEETNGYAAPVCT